MKKWIIPVLASLFAVIAIVVTKARMGEASTSFSPVPELVHYQARLTDADGLNFDGEVAVRVFVYDDPVLGTSGDVNDEHLLYAEDCGDVRVERGMLRLTIGSGEPLGKFSGAPLPIAELSAAGGLYVDLSLNGEWLSPRQMIGFYPHTHYAQYARTADTLEGELHLITDNLPDVIPASKVIGMLNVERLPVLSSDLLSGTVSSARLPGNLPLDRLVSGTLLESVLPNIDGSRISSGVFGASQMPAELLGEGQVAFHMGSASDGGFVTLPAGFAPEECAWIVGLADNGTIGISNGIDEFKVYTGSDIKTKTYGLDVHCEFMQFFPGSDVWVSLGKCNVNYLVVCKH